MTLEELKAEAKEQGFYLIKIPAKDTCSCYCQYPHKDKCKDYYPIGKKYYWGKGYCKKREIVNG